MTLSRYSRAPRLDLGAQMGTSEAAAVIRSAIKNGTITFNQIVVRGAERLDTIAGDVYGDSRYWWILAAASDIGWGLQVPVGTLINVPALGDIAQLVG